METGLHVPRGYLRALGYSLGITLAAGMSACTYDRAPEAIPNTLQVSYQIDIKPIIATNCYSCHTANATDPHKAGYAFLDNYEELKSYALRPSNANPNLTKLQARIRFVETPGMPLKGPMPEDDIKKIEAWIKAGAPNN